MPAAHSPSQSSSDESSQRSASAASPSFESSLSVFAVSSRNRPVNESQQPRRRQIGPLSSSSSSEFLVSTWSSRAEASDVTVSTSYPAPSTLASGNPRDSPPSSSFSDSHIPRPSNSWILFRKSYVERAMHDGRKEHGHPSQAAAQAWRNLPAAERQYWEHLAELEKERHTLQHPGYKYQPKRKKAATTGAAPSPPPATADSSPRRPRREATRSQRSIGTTTSSTPSTVTTRPVLTVPIPPPVLTHVESDIVPVPSNGSTPTSATVVTTPITFAAPVPTYSAHRQPTTDILSATYTDPVIQTDHTSYYVQANTYPEQAETPLSYDVSQQWATRWNESSTTAPFLNYSDPSLHSPSGSEVGPHRRNIHRTRSFPAPYSTSRNDAGPSASRQWYPPPPGPPSQWAGSTSSGSDSPGEGPFPLPAYPTSYGTTPFVQSTFHSSSQDLPSTAYAPSNEQAPIIDVVFENTIPTAGNAVPFQSEYTTTWPGNAAASIVFETDTAYDYATNVDADPLSFLDNIGVDLNLPGYAFAGQDAGSTIVMSTQPPAHPDYGTPYHPQQE